jgi:hypothetical protein
VVALGDNKENEMADTLLLILAEMRETRRVLCEATRVEFIEL